MTSALLRIVLATSSIIAALPAHAREPIDIDRVAACANERDDARRLACYDDAVAAANKPASVATSKPPVQPSAPSPSTATTAPAATPAAPVSTANEFGVAGSAVARQREQELAQQRGESDKVESITAEVTAVSTKPYGELVITLDNGQVWAQKRKERYFAAKPGDKAIIDAGMLGSYRMIIGNRSTHVTRVK